MQNFGYNSNAIYVNCDGAMDYAKNNPGGAGFHVEFPERINLEPISETIGRFEQNNIERIELMAIRGALKALLGLVKTDGVEIRKANTIIMQTDRNGLSDENRTNRFRIAEWRKNKGENFEGKPIKNFDLLDEVDKLRTKVEKEVRCRIEIKWIRRKFNKKADKLAEAGKKKLLSKSNKRTVEKIGKRKYSEGMIAYDLLKAGDIIKVHVYRKESVRDKWEISVEICAGPQLGKRIKIYADPNLERLLHRRHEYEVQIKSVFKHHITICEKIIDEKDSVLEQKLSG